MREMDGKREKWRNRPVSAVKVIFVDATCHKAHADGIVVPMATFVVTGVLEDCHWAILAMDSDLGFPFFRLGA